MSCFKLVWIVEEMASWRVEVVNLCYSNVLGSHSTIIISSSQFSPRRKTTLFFVRGRQSAQNTIPPSGSSNCLIPAIGIFKVGFMWWQRYRTFSTRSHSQHKFHKVIFTPNFFPFAFTNCCKNRFHVSVSHMFNFSLIWRNYSLTKAALFQRNSCWI